jgi:transcriptional regulator with XRE-family HTH domain
VKRSSGAQNTDHVKQGDEWTMADNGALEAPTPGARLRRLRMRAGIKSAAQAARRLNMPRETYAQHENGLNAVTAAQAQAYGKFFGVPASVILYGDDTVIYPEAMPQQRPEVIGQVNERGLVQPLTEAQRRQVFVTYSNYDDLMEMTVRTVLHAAVIATDHLAPVYYRGDFVFFQPLAQPLMPEEVDGREVVLSTTHARKMLAVLHRQRVTRTWEIHVVNREPIIGRHVYLASVVRWIKRAVTHSRLE